jgi:hypothetical protein
MEIAKPPGIERLSFLRSRFESAEFLGKLRAKKHVAGRRRPRPAMRDAALFSLTSQKADPLLTCQPFGKSV